MNQIKRLEQTIENLSKLNKYEQIILNNYSIEMDEEKLTGIEIVKRIIQDTAKGNYKVYNMVFGAMELAPKAIMAKIGLEAL